MDQLLSEINPKELVEFIERVRDLKGYLMALVVSYGGTEERLLEHAEYFGKVVRGRIENDDPEEMVSHLMQTRGKLAALIAGYPETEGEALPAMKVIDSIFDQIRIIN